MNYKDQIKELAWTVNEGLSIYIAIHNSIFQESYTLMSFIKNLFGRGVPMAKFLEHAEKLVPIWDSIQNKIDDFKSTMYLSLSKDEKCYFDLLANYVIALRKTVDCLVERQKYSEIGSRSFLNNPLSWKAFIEKERAYKTSINEYLTIGQQLNDMAQIIF